MKYSGASCLKPWEYVNIDIAKFTDTFIQKSAENLRYSAKKILQVFVKLI